MATFVFDTTRPLASRGLSFEFLSFYNVFTGTTTALTFADSPQNQAILSGTTFASTSVNGQLQDVTAGTITSMTVTENNAVIFDVQGWSLSAVQVFDLVSAGLDRDLQTLLYQDSDTFTLSNKNDNWGGGTGNDTILGLNGNDKLSGGAGNDSLVGGVGNDSLLGGNGRDTLVGSAGNDILTGDVGRDQFVFQTATNAATNVDTITDFEIDVDKIILDNAIFIGVGLDGRTLSATRFALDAAADANDLIIYSSATGEIRYDADGDGAGLAVLFARVDPGTLMTATDFQII